VNELGVRSKAHVEGALPMRIVVCPVLCYVSFAAGDLLLVLLGI